MMNLCKGIKPLSILSFTYTNVHCLIIHVPFIDTVLFIAIICEVCISNKNFSVKEAFTHAW